MIPVVGNRVQVEMHRKYLGSDKVGRYHARIMTDPEIETHRSKAWDLDIVDKILEERKQ
jgi:hypothetical protein